MLGRLLGRRRAYALLFPSSAVVEFHVTAFLSHSNLRVLCCLLLEEEEIGQEEQAAIAKRLFVTKLRRFAGLPSDVSVSEIPDECVAECVCVCVRARAFSGMRFLLSWRNVGLVA